MDPIELLLVGDVNTKQDGILAEAPLTALDGVLAAADVRLGNLEGAFSDPGVGLDYKPGWFHSEPEGFALIDGRFDAVACANNVHHGDAIAPSMRLLDRAGVAHTGAGADRARATEPAIVERGGRRIGMLAYTAIFWPTGHAAGEDSPGVATVRVTTSYQPHPRLLEMPAAPALVHSAPWDEDLRDIESDIALLRERVDLVVVYFHWGITGDDRFAQYQQLLGRAAIDAGADIIAGSHPHIPQGVEFHGAGVILYSLGNFMFGWRKHPHMTRDGLIARVDVRDDEPWSLSLLPVTRTDAGEVVGLPPGDADGERIASRVAELSADQGVELDAAGDRWVLRPRSGASRFGTRVSRHLVG